MHHMSCVSWRAWVNPLILLISASSFAGASQAISSSLSFERTVAIFGTFSKLNNPCAREIWDQIEERNTLSDQMVASLVERHLPEYGGGLIIIDSGHAHSIAAAVRLAELGYEI